MDVVISNSGVPIRLTDERWFHIVENHDDLAGHYDEVLAARGESLCGLVAAGGQLL